MKQTLVFIAALLLISSCEEDQQDTSSSQTGVQKQTVSAVDISVKETATDSYNLLTLTKNVYDNNGNLVKTIVTNDTLPFLGQQVDTLDTGRTYTDQDGDDQEVDTVIVHPKHYNYYVTLKSK